MDHESNDPLFTLDVNECAERTHNCSDNENCVNIFKGFYCNCKTGYKRNRKNECVGNIFILLYFLNLFLNIFDHIFTLNRNSIMSRRISNWRR
jgi:hypothetical protein